ncbi:MAG: SsrA-binding protein SmpB [Bacteroidetes bacterium]|jgi:SsrA-binding protein|nr:SsrA-binding protein SmpB [Bacteroidota bacterium]MBL0015766.1 SsrA-binding protein SmpB [Bacteroidota bacterium]MBP6639220.1 SsrA-binding protein SmpB [Bacteroidia bacterium]
MAKNKEDKSFQPTINNRKASHEYTYLDIYEAGIVLTGTEIKAVREGKVQFADAYCLFKDGELFVVEMHISPYDFGNINNEDPRRERKLLLAKKELKKLKTKADEKGLTIIPTKMYFSDRNFAKIQIALAKGKKLFDKRNDIKDKDTDRQLKREIADI